MALFTVKFKVMQVLSIWKFVTIGFRMFDQKFERVTMTMASSMEMRPDYSTGQPLTQHIDSKMSRALVGNYRKSK